MLLFLIMEKFYVEKPRRKEFKNRKENREERVFEEDRINMIKVLEMRKNDSYLKYKNCKNIIYL